MDEKLKEALTLLDNVIKQQEELLVTGLLPKILHDSYEKILPQLRLISNYVKDTEHLKTL